MLNPEKKILGVIGGLGPIATAHFMELVIRMTDAATDQQNLNMIIYNCPDIPDRTGYILGSSPDSPLPGMIRIGKALSEQGAAYIAIPCVTAHYFHEELSAAISAPIIHGVRETVEHLKEFGVTSAGIMATDGTIATGLLSKALEEAGINPVLPARERQADVMHLIYNNIKAGLPAEMERFQLVQQDLRDKGAQAIILGCTELSLIKRDCGIGAGFLDAMEVLAKRSVELCGGKLKEEYRCLITK